MIKLKDILNEGKLTEAGVNVWYFYKKANKDKNKFFKMLSDFRKKHSDTKWIKMLNYALKDFNENPKKYKTIDDKQNILFKNLQKNKKVYEGKLTEAVGQYAVNVQDTRKNKQIQSGHFTSKDDANKYIKDMMKKHKLKRQKGFWGNPKTGVEMLTNFQESMMINMKDLIKKQGDMIRKESGMNLVTEKKNLPDKALMNIKKMTDRNNHTENRRYLSSLMGNDKLAQFYKAMATLNLVFNGTNSEMNKLNQKMEKEFYKQIRKSFANAEEIIGLF